MLKIFCVMKGKNRFLVIFSIFKPLKVTLSNFKLQSLKPRFAKVTLAFKPYNRPLKKEKKFFLVTYVMNLLTNN